MTQTANGSTVFTRNIILTEQLDDFITVRVKRNRSKFQNKHYYLNLLLIVGIKNLTADYIFDVMDKKEIKGVQCRLPIIYENYSEINKITQEITNGERKKSGTKVVSALDVIYHLLFIGLWNVSQNLEKENEVLPEKTTTH